MDRVSSSQSCHMMSLTSMRLDRSGRVEILADIASELAQLQPLATRVQERARELGWSKERTAKYAFAHDVTIGCFLEMQRQHDVTRAQMGLPPVDLRKNRNYDDRNPYPTGE
jgi:hypothetical protein